MSINKKLYRSGPYADLFSQGVQVGKRSLYGRGKLVPRERSSAGKIWAKKMSWLRACKKCFSPHANMDNIVDETWFVTDIDDCMAKVKNYLQSVSVCMAKLPK
ncbi:MAG: hypothetical protein CM15mP17_04410 [Gammaproteobacteria bacterium]|nr:MAG: hypothetical protein CM15mP17_04410 [Gammaproteobacteria bacterium]